MVVLRRPQAFGWLRPASLAGLALTLAVSGCQTATGTGAAAGAAIGTGVGAIASRGCPGGAIIGGLIGAGAGALGGAVVDGTRERRAERVAATNAAIRAPSLEEVVTMTQSAVPPAQIAEQIRTSGAVYTLTPQQVIWLNQQGVNGMVVQAMQDTAFRAPRRVVYTAAPVVVEQPVYVAPPPVAVGVGFGR